MTRIIAYAIIITVLYNGVMDGEIMAKQIEGVYGKILSSAKREFMARGYMNASLRTIAAMAETTTGSIYTRFGGKEELFEAIVGEEYNHFMNLFVNAQKQFIELSEEEQTRSVGKISSDCMKELLYYCNEHLDEFELILCKADGTKFAGLLDKMVEIEIDCTHRYQKVLERQGIKSPKIDSKLEHILVTGMFNAFFEMIIHRMELQEAEVFLEELKQFYTAGWMKIMGQ